MESGEWYHGVVKKGFRWFSTKKGNRNLDKFKCAVSACLMEHIAEAFYS